MKLKKLIAALVAVVMMMSLTAVAAFAEDREESASPLDAITGLFEQEDMNPMHVSPPTGDTLKLTNFALVAQYTGLGYNGGEQGPIIITKGTLKVDGQTCDIYLVTITGMELMSQDGQLVLNQATDPVTVGLAGMEQKNDLAWNVRKAMKQYIPKDSNVVFAGHSLGGMVAQQVAATESIQKRYNILHTVAFGSPAEFVLDREGTMIRLADMGDIVPTMTLNGDLANNDPIYYEDGGYGDMDLTFDAHRNSYFREDEWGKYDALGDPNGDAVITLDLTTQQFVKAPWAFTTLLG